MSNETNSILYQQAAEMIDYFEGKLPAQLIEQALDSGDLVQLNAAVNKAWNEMYKLEFRPDTYEPTDAQIEAQAS